MSKCLLYPGLDDRKLQTLHTVPATQKSSVFLRDSCTCPLWKGTWYPECWSCRHMHKCDLVPHGLERWAKSSLHLSDRPLRLMGNHLLVLVHVWYCVKNSLIMPCITFADFIQNLHLFVVIISLHFKVQGCQSRQEVNTHFIMCYQISNMRCEATAYIFIQTSSMLESGTFSVNYSCQH